MGYTKLLSILPKIYNTSFYFFCILKPYYHLLYKRPTIICSKMSKQETNQTSSIHRKWKTCVHFLFCNFRIKLYWMKHELYSVHFYSSVMSCGHFLNFLKYLHFSNNYNPTTEAREDSNYDRLQKIRQIFNILNSKFSQLYHTAECTATYKVIIQFKGKDTFCQCLKKPKIWNKNL
jgi:hypothetical protein